MSHVLNIGVMVKIELIGTEDGSIIAGPVINGIKVKIIQTPIDGNLGKAHANESVYIATPHNTA